MKSICHFRNHSRLHFDRRRNLAFFMALCMVLTTLSPSFAAEIKDATYYAGDIVVAVNNCTDAVTAFKSNPMESIRDAELVFRTQDELTGAAGTQEDESEEEGFIPLLQAFEESGADYINVISDMPYGEDGPCVTERFYSRTEQEPVAGTEDSGSLLGEPEFSYKVGDTKTIAETEGGERNVELVCMAIGNNCTVWCEKDSGHPEYTMSETHAKELVSEFDKNWNNFVSYFGDYRTYPSCEDGVMMDIDGDGKLAILSYDINNFYANGQYSGNKMDVSNVGNMMSGYFIGEDLKPGSDTGCRMDCIHINTIVSMSTIDEDYTITLDEEHIFGNIRNIYSTLFHELQHLTEAAITTGNPLPAYLDEAFAMAAEHLVEGQESVSSRVKYFNEDYTYGCPLTVWCYDDLPMNSLDNYSSSYLFGQYLRTRYSLEGMSSKKSGNDRGADVYTEILKAYRTNLLNASGDSYDYSALSAKAVYDVFGIKLEELVGDFWYAVCVQDANGKFSFSSDGTDPEEWSKQIQPRYETRLPGGKAKIYNSGVKFYSITAETVLEGTTRKNVTVDVVEAKKKSFNVEFKVKNPSEENYSTDEAVDVKNGQQVEEPETPEAQEYGVSDEEYDFSGWFTDPKLKYVYDFNTPIVSNKVIYGGWIRKDSKKEITVEYLPNAPEGATVTGTMEVQKATSSTIFKLKKNEYTILSDLIDYEFLGWGSTPDFSDPECELFQDTEQVVFERSRTLYALWQKYYDHIVVFDAYGGDPDTCIQVDDGEKIKETEVGKPVREGFTFLGWWYMDSDSRITKFSFDTPITEDMYLYARWQLNSSVDEENTVTTVKPDAAVTPVTVAANGNQLLGSATISVKTENLTAEEKQNLVTAGTWDEDAWGYWSLRNVSGTSYRNCWALVSDALGSKPVGNASWYYFGADGKMVTGWQWITGADGKRYCYYFNREDGSMYGACVLNGTTIDHYQVNAKGRWVDANGQEQTK